MARRKRDARKKIAILGGGPAGLSTAFHLTSQPGWKDRYDVTLYSLGWRMGGKAASSRNADAGGRIEEHGIHLFANFYANMFGMLRTCYDELYLEHGEPVPTDERVTSLDQAFTPSNLQTTPDYYDGSWHLNSAWMPNNDGIPWRDLEPLPPDALMRELLATLYATITGRHLAPTPVAQPTHSGWLGRRFDEVRDGFERVSLDVVERLLEMAEAHSRDGHAPAIVVDVLNAVDRWVYLRYELAVGRERDIWRWRYVQINFYSSVMRGLIASGLLEGTQDIDELDRYNYDEWLRLHGATDLTMSSSLPQVVTNVCFCYPHGDASQRATIAASVYLYFLMQQLRYRGAAMYFFVAGTGEVVITPLYRALKKRGVRFEFFSKVVDMVPDGDQIDRIEIDVQATLAPGVAEYDPLFFNNGMWCWPARPHYDQLAEGPELRQRRVDLESYWTDWKPVARTTLTRGRDFDYAVLAISIAALPAVCGSILEAREDWREMVDNLQAHPTQQLQIWLDRDVEELGWTWNRPYPDRIVGATYIAPYTDFADYSELIAYENWGENSPPRGLIYFCGPLAAPAEWPSYDDAAFPRTQRARGEATAVQYLRDMKGLMPAVGDGEHPTALPFSWLHCHTDDDQTVGEHRVGQQFVKVNIDPTERYVASLPHTVKYRKKAWESGFTNLALAGDWIYTGMNVGSIDCATASGALASYALTHRPALDEIPDYAFMHPGTRGSDAPLMDDDA